jgi:hypothetical protein
MWMPAVHIGRARRHGASETNTERERDLRSTRRRRTARAARAAPASPNERHDDHDEADRERDHHDVDNAAHADSRKKIAAVGSTFCASASEIREREEHRHLRREVHLGGTGRCPTTSGSRARARRPLRR